MHDEPRYSFSRAERGQVRLPFNTLGDRVHAAQFVNGLIEHGTAIFTAVLESKDGESELVIRFTGGF